MERRNFVKLAGALATTPALLILPAFGNEASKNKGIFLAPMPYLQL